MTRTAPARALVGIALAVTTLAGCQAGQDAATSQEYNPVDGRNVNVPAGAVSPEPYVAVRDAVLVAKGDAGALVMTVVNHTEGAEVLNSATLQGKPVIMPGGPIDIAPGQSVNIGSDAGALAGLPNLGVPPGHWADLSLNFIKSGPSEFKVLAVEPGDIYVPDLEADVVDTFLNAVKGSGQQAASNGQGNNQNNNG